MRLDGAAVLVTGASSGIGRALCLELARRGARVLGAARNEAALQELGLDYVVCDVSRDEDCRRAVASCVERFGHIDLLVCNAGVGRVGLLEETSVEDIRTVFETNTLGAVRCALAAVPLMRARGSGTIAFMASMYGRAVLPYAGNYCISKHALLAFVDTLRLEVGAGGIHVLAVNPGGVDTPIWERASEASGRKASPVGPLVELDDLVRQTCEALERDREEIFVPASIRRSSILQRLGPKAQRRLTRRWLGGRPIRPKQAA
jgi:NAD(P)-dependent dehydrogenase (short-subunit alcohol dehydrogenase family)